MKQANELGRTAIVTGDDLDPGRVARMANTPKDTLRRLADDEPYRHDIFVALVAPIGSSRVEVTAALEGMLGSYGYDTDRVHLAGLLEKVPNLTAEPLPDRSHPDYYNRRMDAGNRLRGHAGDWSALAALAVMRIAAHRDARRTEGERGSKPVAYVLDSLKNPREAELLRAVYGSALWLVAVVEDMADRKSNLTDELAKSQSDFDVPEARAVELMARDEAEEEKHGQRVRDVFAMADFFLPVRRGVNWRDGVDRFLRGVFGAPFLTPTKDEDAMRHAQAAALRSAAVGRQVGAAIVPVLGAPFLLGTNEVPKPGGGQFREGDEPDYRDFRTGSDPNPAYTERVLNEVMERLARAKFFTSERNGAGGGGAAILREASTPDEHGKSVLDGTRAKALIEFTRCLHAEQAAIVDAARTGVAIAGARLYTTTFPCHECTKFIVGAGITEVQYIEPYPKSLAGDLYRDLIDAVPPLEDENETEVGHRVPFRPFLGFGPTRYDDVFVARQRRSGGGLAKHNPLQASPVGHGWSEQAVQERQDEVTVAIVAVTDSIEVATEDSKVEVSSAVGDGSTDVTESGSDSVRRGI